MRITDLLDRRSVSLTAAPKTKSETLDMGKNLLNALQRLTKNYRNAV